MPSSERNAGAVVGAVGATSVAVTNGVVAVAVAAIAAISFTVFCFFTPFFAFADVNVASVAFCDCFLALPWALDAAVDDIVVAVAVAVVVVVVATTPSFLAGRFVLFPRRGESPPSPALAMGYSLRAVMGATTQFNTRRRIMKLREGVILMELVSNTKKIFF